MTATADTRRTDVVGSATRTRRHPLNPRVRRLVLVTVALGIGLAATVAALFQWTGHTDPSLTLDWLPGRYAAVVLVVLTALAESAAVRFRHGETIEELTLLGPALVVSALLLPPATALATAGVALLVEPVVSRREPVKVAFNLGAHLAGMTALVAVLGLVGPSPGGFTPVLVAALLVGTAAYSAVNLLCMSALFATMERVRLVDVLRAEARLSGVMALGTVALAALIVAVAMSEPILLPATALPAAAVMYSYRAIVQEAEERRRSASLLAFSQTLASSPDLATAVKAFLDVVMSTLAVDEGLVLFGDGRAYASRRESGDGVRRVTTTPTLAALRDTPVAHVTEVADGLPEDWSTAILAPLHTENEKGMVVLGARTRTALGARTRNLLTPVIDAFEVALRNSEHLAAVAEQTAKLEAVIEASSDGIVVLDGSGTVQLWNPAMEKLSGREQDVAVGAYFADVFDARDPKGSPADAFNAGTVMLRPGAPAGTVEFSLLRSDGEGRVVRCAFAGVFEDGQPVRYVVILHDLTRERQVDRLKADFIATVSHELRTPVTPIKGYADLLRKRGDTMTPEKRHQCLDLISDRAAHLSRLVEDLLLVSRMSNGAEPERPVVADGADLRTVVEQSVSDFREATDRIRLSLPDREVMASCDPMRVGQIVTNLVSNALKYSPDEGPVEVTVEAAGRMGRVSVSDQGRGIPADQMEQIFDKFHRVEDPAVMTTSGTGLGLFIARQLSRAMGGDVSVRSVFGQGSTFVLVLPLAP